MIPFTFEQLRRVIGSRKGSDKETTLARVGETLLMVQDVEASLRFVMTFVIQQGEEEMDLARYETQTRAERKKTIGYFLSQLRRRVDVEPTTDARLSAFLDMRNLFVHKLDEVPGWGLDDEASLAASNDFLTDLLATSFYIYLWLAGITKSWARQVGMTTKYDDEEIVRMIDEHFVPLAEWSLAPKDSSPTG